MKTVKTVISAVLIFVMLTAQAFAADVYETGVKVTLDGNEIIYSGVHEPVIKNGRTLVPMRKTFEAMGAGVIWSESERSVTARRDGVEITLGIGRDEMLVTSGESTKTVELDVPPELLPYDSYADTTMVPLRAVSEAFDCKVEWDEKTYVVTITSAKAEEPAVTAAPTAAAPPTAAQSAAPAFDPSKISDGARIASYRDRAAYIKDDGGVYMLGGNKVPGVERAVQVALGKNGGYALTDGGEVYSWGSSNDYGELGGADIKPDGTARKIEGLENIKEIGAGAYFGVALTRHGEIYAWGRNDKGQLGNGTTENSAVPTEVRLGGAVDIAAGDGFAAAVTSDGKIYTWGENGEGQLGRGNAKLGSSSLPGKITEISNIKSVSAGPTGAAAIRADNSVYAWGTVYIGALGSDEDIMYHDKNENMPIIADEDGYYRYDRPRRIPYCEYNIDKRELEGHILLGVTAVSCGEYQFAALSGGKIYMWGDSPVISGRRHSQYEHYYAEEYASLNNVRAVCSADKKTVYALCENGDIVKITYGSLETVASVK